MGWTPDRAGSLMPAMTLPIGTRCSITSEFGVHDAGARHAWLMAQSVMPLAGVAISGHPVGAPPELRRPEPGVQL